MPTIIVAVARAASQAFAGRMQQVVAGGEIRDVSRGGRLVRAGEPPIAAGCAAIAAAHDRARLGRRLK